MIIDRSGNWQVWYAVETEDEEIKEYTKVFNVYDLAVKFFDDLHERENIISASLDKVSESPLSS